MWLVGIFCAALVGVGVLRFRRVERRWRWRWQELPSGEEHRGPGGVYREERVVLALGRAPRLVRWAALVALVAPAVAFAAWSAALLVPRPAERPCYELVFALELGSWAIMSALAWRAAGALLARNGAPLGMRALAIGALVGAVAFAGCATQFSLGWRLHVCFVHYDALVYELGVVQVFVSLVPAVVLAFAARRFRRELRAPTRYVEWGRGFIEA